MKMGQREYKGLSSRLGLSLKDCIGDRSELRTAYNLIDKRTAYRIQVLKVRNDELTVEVQASNRREDVMKQRHNHSIRNRDLKIEDLEHRLNRAEGLLRERTTEKKESEDNCVALYDLVRDTQHYTIAIEHLLKAQNNPAILWPYRPFKETLTSIKE